MPDPWVIAGLVLTLVLGVATFFVAKKVRKNRQSQSVKGGSTGYQAGGDIRINEKLDER